MPVDWFITLDGTILTIYYAEGLGTYPATAILIYEYMKFTDCFNDCVLR